MKFSSAYFKNADELLQAKKDAFTPIKERRERLDVIRRFTNMMNTMTEEEAEQLGISEITNHGLTYKAMLQNETQYTSMVVGTNALVDIVVDTDNPEQDWDLSLRLSYAINQGAIHRKGKFRNFWRKVAGEIVMCGGAPIMMPEKYGWLPEVRVDMFFPAGTELDAESVPYAFDPTEITIQDLMNLRDSAGDEGGSFIDVEEIDALIVLIRKRINGQGTTTESTAFEVTEATRSSNGEKKASLPAWWYYETKYPEKDGDPYVSATLLVDAAYAAEAEMEAKIHRRSEDSGASNARVVAYIDKLWESSEDWMYLPVVDAEIGGIKNMDSLKGVAEMNYPSGVDMEELLNAIIEGEKIRARPKVRMTNDANPEEVLAWDIMQDTVAPKGVEEFPIKTTTSGLQAPLALLSQNAAGIATAPVSNGPGGGELRQQALERQHSSSIVQGNRVADAYEHLDAILEMIVWRLLAGPVKKGCSGYNEIMWVRSNLEKYGIDYKKLATRKHGRFEFLRVRAKRAIGNGDRQQTIETADWMMSNVQNYEPAVRPFLVQKATAMRTQDPDLADFLVKPPKAILNAQKVTAENEYDTIRRRAPLGQVLPISPDDIHQDHMPIHLLDMQAHVASHSIRPWDKLDVLVFAGASEHAAEHLKVMLTSPNPGIHGEGLRFVQDYQNIAQAAQRIVAEIESKEGSEQIQLTPKEQAELQLKWSQHELEARKFGLKVEDTRKLWENREARAAISQRGQFVKEINDDRRLRLDAQRDVMQAEAQKSNNG